MQFTDGENLHNTVLYAPIGICILDADTLVAELVNDNFLEVAGKSYGAIYGQFYWDAFAEARSYYEEALNSVVRTGEAYYADEVELMLIRHGREEMIFVTFVYAPVKNKAGKINKVAVWVLENTKQVNERQKMEASRTAFQQERDRLKRFFMQAPAGICILDGPELTYELVNPHYQELLPGRELLGRPIFEALPELVGTPLQQVLLNVYQTGEPYEIHELLIPVAEQEGGPTRDRYFSFSYQARRDENDRVDGILVFVFEVTSMISVQHELRGARERSEQQKRVYETITSGTPDLMYVFDLNYRFTYANSALLSMWGKTWENSIGKSLLENGYEPWHAEIHEREIDQIKATKQSIRGEVSFPHATLGKRVYDYILTPVFNEQGEVEAVAGITRDVTDRKQGEESLAQASEELQAINEEMVAVNEEQAASNEELTATNRELELANQRLLAAQQEIEEGKIALRLAIDAANFGTWFIHSVTREFITDARLKELFGYYPDEPLSIEQALAQITDEYRGFVATKLENAITGGGDYDVTYPVIGLHDQRLRWLRAIGNLKADPSGAFSAFTGVVMDVTERQHAEEQQGEFTRELQTINEEMAASNEELTTTNEELTTMQQRLEDTNEQLVASASRLRMAIESTKLGTWDYDPRSGALFWSDECRDIYGIPSDSKATFAAFSEHIHPDDRSWVQKEIQKAMHPVKGGRYELSFRILRFDNGETRWIKSHGTVYFEQEQAIRFIGTVLDITDIKEAEEQSAKLAAIIQSSDDAIISKTPDSIITSWNAAAERIFGYPAEEMIGESIYKLIPEDRLEEEPQILARLRSGERVEHFETIRQTKDGRLIDVSLTISPLKDPQGNIIGLSKIARDITEKKLDETRKSDFIGMVSHELKTPLTSLGAIIQVANTKLKNNEDAFLSGAMQKADRQVKRMSAMINGFLNISRLESGKIHIDKQDLDMEALIADTIEEANLTTSTHLIHFVRSAPVPVNADRDKIGSVISNFISNAVKYSPKGKHIEVSCNTKSNEVIVSVKDEGMGIKPDDLAKIFDRYYRVETNHTRHIAGFGIGLYLSSEIIERHGGRVWAESESGVGSTFYFSLPLSEGI
jgi:PAS domain S-box-containing protein